MHLFFVFSLTMFSRFIHVVAWIRTSFIFMTKLYFVVWRYHTLFTHYQFVDIWVVSTFWLLWIMLLWTLVYNFFYKNMFFLLLDIYLGVESTGSYSNSMFNFLMNCQTMAVPILSQQQEINLLFKPVFFGVLMCIQLGLVINSILGHQVSSVL